MNKLEDKLNSNNKIEYIIENNILREVCIFDDDIKKIKIPDGVKVIGSLAFNSCNYLEEIVLPDGLIKIEMYAFRDCRKLKKIDIPESVKEIGEYAFCDCCSLKEISLSKKSVFLKA